MFKSFKTMPRMARNHDQISKQCLSVKKCEEEAIYWDEETNCCTIK